MSETIPSSDPGVYRPSTNFLKSIVIALLARLFLWSCDGDPALARLAAAEALNEFGITGYRGLIIAARIIAFELAALSSLSLSMADDMPPALALRLRGNANSLDRATERNRQALEIHRRAARTPPVDVDAVAASVAETQKLVRTATACMQAAPPSAKPPRPEPVQPLQPSDDQQLWNAAWAQAMTEVAAEFTADLAKLPPAEQAREKSRIEVLLEAATALASGTTAPVAAGPVTGRAGAAGGTAGATHPGQSPG
jgi:hypothetical protein